ncbi:MAG: cation transporter [Deltaproteobacteria bacterium]|nr:cation transporter [Deltaproteobacteria bacterium]MBW2388278.1 cation transporter [Deltaproteobacteria bacterium]MBW2725249.1 cation transporter [Deltaproteobacteria bacterium]
MTNHESGTRWARAGAVISAALASMCCILPLGLGALGISTTLVAAFFEPLRPWFLALAAALVALGFYFALRTPRGEEACSTEAGRLAKLSKPALWISTAAVLLLAMFPTLSGLASNSPRALSPGVASEIVVLRVDGMTCETCAPSIRTALLDVPGVIDAAVDYDKKMAEVRVRAERRPDAAMLLEAVRGAGYDAQVADP